MYLKGSNFFRAILLLSVIISLQGSLAQENECNFNTSITRAEFDVKVQFAKTDIHWYPEWLDLHGGKVVLPSPIPKLEKWQHPSVSVGLPHTMHEDSKSTDVSNFPGPIPSNVSIQYFHVLEKGFDGRPTLMILDEAWLFLDHPIFASNSV